MKPDFIIISSRLNKIFKDRFLQVTASGSVDYMVFFPPLERKILEVFFEYELNLLYRGKTKNVFPTTIIWGSETITENLERVRTGEISVQKTNSNKKIATLSLSFRHDKGLKLLAEPRFSITE